MTLTGAAGLRYAPRAFHERQFVFGLGLTQREGGSLPGAALSPFRSPMRRKKNLRRKLYSWFAVELSGESPRIAPGCPRVPYPLPVATTGLRARPGSTWAG